MKKTTYLIMVLFFLYLPVNAQSNQEDQGRFYYDIGIFAYEDEDYNEAESNFLKAVSFNPENPAYNHYLGKTYMKMERFQDAQQYLIKAMQVNPGLYQLKYDMGTLRYEQEDYLQAYELFAETARENPSDAKAVFHGAMSLFKLERYNEAVNLFNTAAEKDSWIKPHALYYSGVCYLKLGSNEKAVENFEYVKANAGSRELRNYAQEWLDFINPGTKKQKFYSIYLKTGYQYDDNAVLESPEGETAGGKEDFVSKVYASLNVDAVNKKHYKFGGGYSHYQTWHNEHNDLDIIASIFNVNAKYRFSYFTAGLTYIPSFYAVDSSTFLVRHQINPDLVFSTSSFLTRLSYSYYDNDYAEDESDGHTQEIGLDVYYNIGNTGINLFGGIGYEDNSAESEDKYYRQFSAKLGALFQMPWEMNLSLAGKYCQKDFDNIEREDDKYSGLISISRKLLYDWLSISAEYDYTKNDSSETDYEYERNAVSLSLISVF
ncbi:DUF560 [Desulfonema limicola]|uniref:DUF560 n=1 Tax=Desulfonema limicola TaxID=45656 RepID=A0A975GGR9_9BACT|nr:tetratricopeptide repeat protein [Desulfonema limicola]QTA80518.1 DUF560 [Desulfonema limicola]